MKNLFGKEITKKQPVSREDLTKVLLQNIKGISEKELVNLITNYFIEIVEYYNLSVGGRCCGKTSLLFNPHRLSIKTKKSKQSVIDALDDDSFISGLSRSILFNKSHGTSPSNLLYRSIQIGVNGVQYVNEFPPHAARDLCKKYGINKDSKVLDPCAGWGGRMIGVSVVCDHYVCFEPVEKTSMGLKKLNSYIKSMNPSFTAKIYNKPFEDSNLKDNFFDLAITSPPYYDTEHYSDQETDSANRYDSFENWTQGFYVPLIEKTMGYLKADGVFILNIGSRTYPLNQILLDVFEDKYKIEKEKATGGLLAPNKGGLRSSEKEGEVFYIIRKKTPQPHL